MLESNDCRDKLIQCHVGGPSKPYIDKNLQLQFPNWDIPSGTHCTHSPIYAHFVGSSPTSLNPSQVNEAEIYQAIQTAESAYESWKKMQRKVNELYAAHVAAATNVGN